MSDRSHSAASKRPRQSQREVLDLGAFEVEIKENRKVDPPIFIYIVTPSHSREIVGLGETATRGQAEAAARGLVASLTREERPRVAPSRL